MGLAATIAGGEAGEYCVRESYVPSCLLWPLSRSDCAQGVSWAFQRMTMLGACVDFRADIKSARELLVTASVTKSENQEAVCDALESMEQVTIYQYIHMHICMWVSEWVHAFLCLSFAQARTHTHIPYMHVSEWVGPCSSLFVLRSGPYTYTHTLDFAHSRIHTYTSEYAKAVQRRRSWSRLSAQKSQWTGTGTLRWVKHLAAHAVNLRSAHANCPCSPPPSSRFALFCLC